MQHEFVLKQMAVERAKVVLMAEDHFNECRVLTHLKERVQEGVRAIAERTTAPAKSLTSEWTENCASALTAMMCTWPWNCRSVMVRAKVLK